MHNSVFNLQLEYEKYDINNALGLSGVLFGL